MVLHKKPIIKVLSTVLIILGIALLIPAVVAMCYSETPVAKAFVVCALPMIAVGLVVFRMLPKIDTGDIRIREGFFIVGFAWIMFSFLGGLPLVICGDIPRIIDSFFEMASGFSTTGSTILTDIEALSKGGLFWRSLTHWMGGMGVLVLTIAILPMLGIGGQRIMRAETTGPTMDKVSFTLNDSAKRLYMVYTGMTVIEVVLLMFGGLNLYDALVHTFGTVGTGGFSSYGASIAAFDSSYIHWVIAIFMMLAGINFNLHYLIVTGKGKKALQDPELRCYVAIVLVCTVFIAVMLVANGYSSVGTSIRDAFFQVNTIITTTGYATVDFDLWPLPCKIVLFLLMLVGGCASSTGGGMKVIRIMISTKTIKREVGKKLHPRAVAPIRIGGKAVAEQTVTAVTSFITLYLVTIAVGTFLISFEPGISFTTALSSVVACISNIGPGFEAVGPTCNFAFFSDFSKLLLSIFMIAGRLEIFTIFLLFTPSFWNANK